MAKLYTLDKKLLCDRPAVQIGDETFTIDDRKKTVEEVLKVVNEADTDNRNDFMEKADKALSMLLTPQKFKQIEKMELSFKAYLELFSLAMAAATGEEPDAISERFQNGSE